MRLDPLAPQHKELSRDQLLAIRNKARTRYASYRSKHVVRNRHTGEIYYRAQPKQDEFHSATERFVLYGGAAGGAKSHAIRWDAILNALRYDGARILILRRTYGELENTHLLVLKSEVPPELMRYRENKKRLIAPNRSIIQFGHAQYLKDIQKYLSTEWDFIYIDEAQTFLPAQLRLLRTRLRTKRTDLRPQMKMGANPGGEAHQYLYDHFILKTVPKTESVNYRPADYLFIKALVTDNAFTADEYIDELLGLPELERMAYLHGLWTAFAGKFFREWDPTIHTIDGRKYTLSPWHEVEAGMDWGYSPHPGVVEWGEFDEFGRCTLYKELVFELAAPREVARMIVDLSKTDAERRMLIRADSAMWIRNPETGVSIAETVNDELARLGTEITLVQANKDRINGWMRTRQYLDPRRGHPFEEGKQAPYLRVVRQGGDHAGCPYLLSTIDGMSHDEKKPGDLKKVETDNGCDALRYLLMGREPLATVPDELLPKKSHEEQIGERVRKLLKRAAEAERAATEAEDAGVFDAGELLLEDDDGDTGIFGDLKDPGIAEAYY